MKSKRVLSSLIVTVVACVLMVAACERRTDDPDAGGQDQDGGQRDSGQSARTPEQVQDDIRAEIEALNYCDSVEDCVSVYIRGTCSQGYINADADRSNLDALSDEFDAVGGLEPPCAAMCETGA